MEQYIKKAAIVAEIEKLISGLRRNCNPNPLGNMQECLAAAQIEAINLIKDFLDTMEVKEVDFEYSRETIVREDAGGYPYIPNMELYDYDKETSLFKKGDKVIIQIKKS